MHARPPPERRSRTPGADVVVIGGGIIGLATACTLMSEGLGVTIIDPGEPGARASSATAGIIAGSSVIPWASKGLWGNIPSMLMNPDGPLRVGWPLPPGTMAFMRRARAAGAPAPYQASARGLAGLGLQGWDAWQALRQKLDLPKDLFAQNGCLLFYPTALDMERDQPGNDLRRRMGMQLQPLDQTALQNMLPGLAQPPAAGMLIPRAGQIADPLALQEALLEKVQGGGGRFVRGRATGFRTSGTNVSAVRTGEGELACDSVVVCAGAAGHLLADALGCTVPLLPAWGASVTFHDPGVELSLPFLVQNAGIAAVPNTGALRISGLLQVGGRPAGRLPRLETILVRQARHLFGDFSFSRKTGHAGARPLTPDSVPVLGPAPGFDNAFFNFGHGHWGATHAAVSGQLVVDLIEGRPPQVDISPYRADRFR